MSPEQTNERLPEAQTPGPEALQHTVDELRTIYGLSQELPETMDQDEMNDELDDIALDGKFENLSEYLQYHELINRKHSMQRQAQLEVDPVSVNEVEFIAVNQGETFFAYYQSVLEQTLSSFDQYLSLRRTIDSVSPELLENERQAENFARELKRAMEQRFRFANAALVWRLLQVQEQGTGEVVQQQQTLQQQLDLLMPDLKETDAGGFAAIEKKDIHAIRLHSNTLDQRILELIAEHGHLPSMMLLGLQSEQYADILDQQNELVPQWGILERINLAGPAHAELHDERRDISNDMIRTTESLSEYHEQVLELLILQHQFKSFDSFTGATAPSPYETPEEVRDAIYQVTEQREDFHRERLSAFINRFEEEVLTIGLPERIEDFSNRTGRDIVRGFANTLSSIFTLPTPEAMGIRDFFQRQLSGSLNETMGWPPDKMHLKFEELTTQEQQAVLERSRSIADAVRAFDRGTIGRVRNSLAVIEALPPSHEALGESPRDPLPELTEPLTPQNLQALIDEYGLPTVYMLAVNQLEADFGDTQSGFMGEVQKFTDSVNDNIDAHLDIAHSLYGTGNKFFWVILGTPVAAYAAWKIFRRRRGSRGTSPETPRTGSTEAPDAGRRPVLDVSEDTPLSPLNNADEVTEGLDDASKNTIRRWIGEGATSDDVDAFLRLAKENDLVVDADLIARIDASPRARACLSEALRMPDAPARAASLNRVLKAADHARALRVGVNVAGAALDVFGIYMAVADWQLNNHNLDMAEISGNAALQELYRDARPMIIAEGVASGTGLVIGSIAIVESVVAGQSVLTAVAAPAAAVMLPVGIAVAGFGTEFRMAQQASEEWLRDEDDWMLLKTPGELLRELEIRKVGERTGWYQGYGAGTVAEQIVMSDAAEERAEERVHTGNLDTRRNLTRAYLTETASLARLEGESDTAYRQRFDQYIADQMDYIQHVTEGTFTYGVSMYRKARLHAEALALSRTAQRGEHVLTWTATDPEAPTGEVTVTFDMVDYASAPWQDNAGHDVIDVPKALSEYSEQVYYSEKILNFSILPALGVSEPQQYAVIADHLLLDSQDEIHDLEGRIATYDFSPWGGYEDWAEAIARYKARADIRAVINEQTDMLRERMYSDTGISVDDYKSALAAIREVCDIDVSELDVEARDGIEASNRYMSHGNIWSPSTMDDALSLSSLSAWVHKEADRIDYARTLTDADRVRLTRERGEEYLPRVDGMERDGDLFSVKYTTFGKTIYFKFFANECMWKFRVGRNGEWLDPAERRVSTGALQNNDVPRRYNWIVSQLVGVNREYKD